jgi:outer membrane protein assembly factor BamD
MMRTLFILFIAALALASCRSQDLIRPGDTLEEAYEKAMNQYEQENYTDAARAFETVISIGRGTDIGQDAQYYLAESYYNNRRYLMAASEYSRYVQFHPNSPRRELVEYREAMCYYHLSPRYKLDQQYTNRAIELFRLFNSRHPNSEMGEEVAERIDELREKLARRDFNAAEFYMRTNRYNSAAIYFDIVIDNYPETVYAERSLVKQIEAYVLYAENSVERRQEERFEKALESYSTYLQLFPQGENRSRAEDLYDRAQQGLNEVRSRESVAQS